MAGKTVSTFVRDDGTISYLKIGNEDGSVSDSQCPDSPSATVTAFNLSLSLDRALYSNSGNIGGNCNNYAPDRSGNSGQNSSGQNGGNIGKIISSISVPISTFETGFETANV